MSENFDANNPPPQSHYSVTIDFGGAYKSPLKKLASFFEQLAKIKEQNIVDMEEGDKGEAVEMAIGALGLFYARGGDHMELVDILREKLA